MESTLGTYTFTCEGRFVESVEAPSLHIAFRAISERMAKRFIYLGGYEPHSADLCQPLTADFPNPEKIGWIKLPVSVAFQPKPEYAPAPCEEEGAILKTYQVARNYSQSVGGRFFMRCQVLATCPQEAEIIQWHYSKTYHKQPVRNVQAKPTRYHSGFHRLEFANLPDEVKDKVRNSVMLKKANGKWPG